MYQKIQLIVLLYFASLLSTKANNLIVQINTQQTTVGNQLNFTCQTIDNSKKAVWTLHLWIEHLTTHKKWKYRFPMIGGYTTASLKIDSSILEGNYAFNFAVQKMPLSIYGYIKNFEAKDSIISCIVSANKKFQLDYIKVDDQGNFRCKKYIFQNKGNFIFMPLRKFNKKNNPLEIELTTTLDSICEPYAKTVKFIKIGNPKQTDNKIDSVNYSLAPEDFVFEKGTLDNVTVTTTRKKPIEEFNEKYSTGVFKTETEKIIDGLETEDMLAGYIDVLDFLNERVSGLFIKKTDNNNISSSNSEMYNYDFSYRSSKTATLFIDEIMVDISQFASFPTREIAMIKIYPPPFLGAWGGNSFGLAIYTRKPDFAKDKKSTNNFTIKGYDDLEISWQ